jgi:2'-5' RNA ligase
VGDAEDGFWPHVTIVRYRPPAARRPEPGGTHEHPFAFDRMSLYDSRTGHGGPPSYVPVAVFLLGSNPTST